MLAEHPTRIHATLGQPFGGLIPLVQGSVTRPLQPRCRSRTSSWAGFAPFRSLATSCDTSRRPTFRSSLHAPSRSLVDPDDVPLRPFTHLEPCPADGVRG